MENRASPKFWVLACCPARASEENRGPNDAHDARPRGGKKVPPPLDLSGPTSPIAQAMLAQSQAVSFALWLRSAIAARVRPSTCVPGHTQSYLIYPGIPGHARSYLVIPGQGIPGLAVRFK